MTLDVDFGNIHEYPPEHYRGLIVLRVVNQSRIHVLRVMEQILSVLDCAPLEGHPWVVSEAGIRIRSGDFSQD